MSAPEEFKSRRHDEEQVDYFYLAIVVSLVVHLCGMLAWNMEKHYQILPKDLFSFLHKVDPSRLLIEKKEPKKPKMRQVTLRFVDVNPEVASTPPVQPKFEGAISSQAANEDPSPTDRDKPKLDGKQTEMIRDRDATLAGGPPSQPTPPPPAPKPPTPKAPEKVEKKPEPPKPKPTPPPPLPEKVVQVAELKQPKPAEKTPPSPKLERRPEAPPAPQPRVQPKKAPEPPPSTRPRSLAAARKAAGLTGEKSKMDGGVTRQGTTALDVLRTAFGEYGAVMFWAMDRRWNQLADQRRPLPVGSVVISFRVHQNGRVSDVRTVSTEVNDLHTSICQMAIRDPSPYRRWPTELVRRYPRGYREITLTFHYR